MSIGDVFKNWMDARIRDHNEDLETKEVRRIILKDNTSSGGKNLRQQATTATGQLKNAQEIILIGPEVLIDISLVSFHNVGPRCQAHLDGF